jgi:hypothetical protein
VHASDRPIALHLCQTTLVSNTYVSRLVEEVYAAQLNAQLHRPCPDLTSHLFIRCSVYDCNGRASSLLLAAPHSILHCIPELGGLTPSCGVQRRGTGTSCPSVGALEVSYRTVPVAWAVVIYAWRAPPSITFLRGPNRLSFIQATHCAEAHAHERHPIHLPFYQQIERMLLIAYHRRVGAQSLLAATGDARALLRYSDLCCRAAARCEAAATQPDHHCTLLMCV